MRPGARPARALATCRGTESAGVLWKRLDRDIPLRLASALHRGALVTEREDPSNPEPDKKRGHFVGPPGMRKHQMLTTHAGRVWPCWEMFVHMAEYGSLQAMASEHEALDLRIEDDQMDLTVRVTGNLVAYVEVKHDADEASRLLGRMQSPEPGDLELRRAYLEETADRRAIPDAIKKAGYLLRSSMGRPATLPPIAFGVRAGGADDARTFLVRPDPHTMELAFDEITGPLPLHVELAVEQDPHRRAQAYLAWTLQRQSRVLLRRGTHGNYVVYSGTAESTPIAVGFERRGSVYTELDAFDDAQRSKLNDLLSRHGLTLGDTSTGKHRLWKSLASNQAFILEDETLARELGAGIAQVLRG